MRPLDTRLLPGHGDASTLADELASNPYVRAAVEPPKLTHREKVIVVNRKPV